jgi:surface protein
MNGMFLGSEAFNQPINDWDTSKVTDMKEMFLSATVFQQDISDWHIGAVSTMEDMFTGITLPTLVYSAILTKWANQATTTGVQAAVRFGAGNSGYLPSAATARSALTSTPYNWVITDGGLAPDTPTGFAATPGDGEITLSWDPVAGASSYEVTGTAAGGLGLSCQSVGSPPGTTCSWTGLTNGLTYTLTLIAKNATGVPSAPTAPLTAAARTTPAAPTITPITPGNRRLTVAFRAGEDGGSPITNYQYSTNGGASWTTRSPISFASPLIITGLTNGTAYNVRIRAVNAAGTGAPSNQITATPSTSAPPTPNPTPGPGPLRVCLPRCRRARAC